MPELRRTPLPRRWVNKPLSRPNSLIIRRQLLKEACRKGERGGRVEMSEQARKVKESAIPEWAQGLYYNKGLFGEALVYHDEEALYFEVRGKDSGVVRFSFAMLETLTEIIEEEQEEARGESPQQ